MRVISGKARGTKLNSIDSLKTRPTLDRVKESLFNILQKDLEDIIVLDLFAGSGALGIEALSRGAKQAYFCDSSSESIQVQKQNLEKTRLLDQAVILNKDFRKGLQELRERKFDLIFLDPPYKTDYVINALEDIISFDLLEENGKIIVETDEEERILKSFEAIKSIDPYDQRKYGRVTLVFLKRRK